MKYTRYDVKSKKKNDDWKTTLMMILGVVVLALLIGSLLFFKFLSPKNDKAKPGSEINKTEGTKPDNNKPSDDVDVPPVIPEDEKDKETPKEEKGTSTTEATTYTVVQCGYFSTKESAEAVKTKIGEKARVLTEGDKFRVVCYIGNEEEAKKLSDKFTTQEIENTKARFSLPAETVTDKSIIEMINGVLDITSKVNESGVASVKSDEFKTWANGLAETKDDAKFKNFSEMKKMINELPTEITSKDTVKVYQVIYDVLSNYK
ncbi:MAG: SPOR domain-containing protein [Sarcina sp.]